MEINRIILFRVYQLFFVLVFVLEAPGAVADARVSDWKLEPRLGTVWNEESTDLISGLKGTYYFEPSEYTFGPYAERDFLNPVTAFSVRTRFDASTGIEKFNSSHLGFDYSIVSGDYIYKPRAHFTDAAGYKTYGVGMDYAHMLTNVSRVSGGVNLTHEQIASDDVMAIKADIGYRKLWQYNSGRALVTELEYEYTNSENESRSYSISQISADFDYYFTRRWGLGFNISQSMSDIKRFESIKLGVSTNYFFNKNVGVDLDVGVVAREHDSNEFNAVLSSVIRF